MLVILSSTVQILCNMISFHWDTE